MKRSHNQNRSNQEKAEGGTLGFPDELLHKILVASPTKNICKLVCKLWAETLTLKNFFEQFTPDAVFRTMHITPNEALILYPHIHKQYKNNKQACWDTHYKLLRQYLLSHPDDNNMRIRFWRLLLDAQTSAQQSVLAQTLEDDPWSLLHLWFTQIQIAKPLTRLELNQDVLNILKKHIGGLTNDMVAQNFGCVAWANIEGGLKEEMKHIVHPYVGGTNLVLNDAEIALLKEHALNLVAHSDDIWDIADIVVKGDSEALNTFLTNENIPSIQSLFGKWGGIQRFCSLETVKKILPALYKKASEDTPRDMILYHCLFHPDSQRLDIAQHMIDEGADIDYVHDSGHEILYNRRELILHQNIPALELLTNNRLTYSIYDMDENGDFIFETVDEDTITVSPLIYLLGSAKYQCQPSPYHTQLSPEFLTRFIEKLLPNVFEVHPTFGDVLAIAQECQPPNIVNIILKKRYSPRRQIVLKRKTGHIKYIAANRKESVPEKMECIGDLEWIREKISQAPALLYTGAIIIGTPDVQAFIRQEREKHFKSNCYCVFINEQTGAVSEKYLPGYTKKLITPFEYAQQTGREWLATRLLAL